MFLNNIYKFIPLFWLTIALFCGCDNSKTDAKTKYDMAIKAYKNMEYKKAIKLFDEACLMMPNHPAILGNRGNCKSYLGDLDGALKDYDMAIKIVIKETSNNNDPYLAFFYYNKGKAYEKAKQIGNAISQYKRTISINPEYPDVKNDLAWILATTKNKKYLDPNLAIKISKALCKKTNWKDPYVIDTLAAAFAASGDFKKAVKYSNQAIKITSDKSLSKELKNHLMLFKNQKTVVE